MTALPIETRKDVSAYIPTNIISITDGQIYLQPALFRCKTCSWPSISVSRVGGSRKKINEKVAGTLKLAYSQYESLHHSLIWSDLDDDTRRLAQGKNWSIKTRLLNSWKSSNDNICCYKQLLRGYTSK